MFWDVADLKSDTRYYKDLQSVIDKLNGEFIKLSELLCFK